MGAGREFRMAVSKILLGGLAVESLMGTEAIVGVFPFCESKVERLDLQIAIVDLIEFLCMGSVGALDVTVQLGRARWKDEEADTTVLTGLFEGSTELGTAVDLNGPDRERHSTKQGIQERRSRGGSSTSIDLEDVPAGDHISCGEVFEHYAGQRADVQGIHLHQVSGLTHPVALGFTYGIGPEPLTLAGGDYAKGRLLENPLLF